MKYLPLTAQIQDILSDNDGELETLINKALLDVVEDLINTYKSPDSARSVQIEIKIAKFGNEQIAVDHKVTPKLAPYIRVQEKKEKVPDGQMSIEDVIEPEVIEPEVIEPEVIEPEVIEPDEEDMLNEDAEEDRQQIEAKMKRYLAITGGGKKKKK